MPKTKKPGKSDTYRLFIKEALKKGKTRMQAAQMLSAKYKDLSLNYVRTLVYKLFPDEPHAGTKRVAWDGKGRATAPKAKAKAKPSKPKAVTKKPTPKPAPKKASDPKAKSLRDVTTEVVTDQSDV